jgi:UDP-glucose 4-epimerase
MKSCLVFGGNGFLGSHLAEKLIKYGYNVKIFDNFQNGMDNLKNVINEIEIINGNFFNDSDVIKAVKDVDYVFHYISTTIPSTAKKDPVFDIESNIAGSVKLLQCLVNSNVKKIVFPSSGGTIYGEPISLPVHETDTKNPVDPYGISKLTIEKYLYYFNFAYGLDYMIFRYSNPYGQRQNPHGKQGVIPIFLNKVKHGEQPIIYGDGCMIRDYIYIDDAIDATMAVLESKTQEKVFNVGSGQGTSINTLIDIMSDITGKNIIPKYIDNNEYYIEKVILDISNIKSEVGWQPGISLEAGIKKTWEWINKSC